MSKEKKIWPFVAIAPEEMDDPFGVIADLCVEETLFGYREDIFDLYTTAMESDGWSEDDPSTKAAKMVHLKRMMRMVEVLYLLNDLRDKGELLEVARAAVQVDGKA